jgi:hypothetical protein
VVAQHAHRIAEPLRLPAARNSDVRSELVRLREPGFPLAGIVTVQLELPFAIEGKAQAGIGGRRGHRPNRRAKTEPNKAENGGGPSALAVGKPLGECGPVGHETVPFHQMLLLRDVRVKTLLLLSTEEFHRTAVRAPTY